MNFRVHATRLRGTSTGVKLVVGDHTAQIKVEVSPVLRGTVFPPEPRQTMPAVQARFGFAEMWVMALPEV